MQAVFYFVLFWFVLLQFGALGARWWPLVIARPLYPRRYSTLSYSSCRRRVRPEVTPGSSLDVDECCEYSIWKCLCVGVEIRRRLQRPHDYIYPGKVNNVWSRVQCFQTAVTECRNQDQESGDLGVPRLKPQAGQPPSLLRCWAQTDVRSTVLDDVQANADGNEWKCGLNTDDLCQCPNADVERRVGMGSWEMDLMRVTVSMNGRKEQPEGH
jgi:hypothetical protein